jgi:hypothetical protein
VGYLFFLIFVLILVILIENSQRLLALVLGFLELRPLALLLVGILHRTFHIVVATDASEGIAPELVEGDGSDHHHEGAHLGVTEEPPVGEAIECLAEWIGGPSVINLWKPSRLGDNEGNRPTWVTVNEVGVVFCTGGTDIVVGVALPKSIVVCHLHH